MTREEAARTLEVATVLLDSIPESDWYAIAASEACRMGAAALRELDAQEKQKTPCDLCLYNPPSSRDGKPCTMCSASSLPESPKEER